MYAIVEHTKEDGYEPRVDRVLIVGNDSPGDEQYAIARAVELVLHLGLMERDRESMAKHELETHGRTCDPEGRHCVSIARCLRG